MCWCTPAHASGLSGPRRYRSRSSDATKTPAAKPEPLHRQHRGVEHAGRGLRVRAGAPLDTYARGVRTYVTASDRSVQDGSARSGARFFFGTRFQRGVRSSPVRAPRLHLSVLS